MKILATILIIAALLWCIVPQSSGDWNAWYSGGTASVNDFVATNSITLQGQSLATILTNKALASAVQPPTANLTNVSNGAGNAANWSASGTTNATLNGIASVNSLVVTQSLTVTGSGQSIFTNGLSSLAPVTITNSNTASIPLTINHANGASADIQQWNVGGANQMKIDKSGNLTVVGTVVNGNILLNGNNIRAPTTGLIYWQSSSVMDAPSNGQVRFTFQSDRATLASVYNAGTFGGRTNVLTSASGKDLFYVSVPNTNAIGGSIEWQVVATDGTETQSQGGSTRFDAVAKGTTVTGQDTLYANTSAVSSGTLTVAFAPNVATNNVFALTITATTSLTTTNLTVRWRTQTPATFTLNPL